MRKEAGGPPDAREWSPRLHAWQKEIHQIRREENAPPAPDLVDRRFLAASPDRLWLADITYLPTREGFLYLAFILDACSRKVVGWSMAAHLRAELVTDALQ